MVEEKVEDSQMHKLEFHSFSIIFINSYTSLKHNEGNSQI